MFVDAGQFIIYHKVEPEDYFFGLHRLVLLLAVVWKVAKGKYKPFNSPYTPLLSFQVESLVK
jgi:hypothetical protein